MSLDSCFLGDSCILWSWGSEINHDLSRRVLRAYRTLKSDSLLDRLGALDVVPAYSSLAVYFDPLAADVDGLAKRVEDLLRRTEKGTTGPHPLNLKGSSRTPLRFPVVYDGEDLDRVASHADLTVEKVIELHTRPQYTVAMIGFLPHFPYLIGMDEQLSTPRLSSPRKRVPAGAVAIGGAQTGIYPAESPGGWNLIGRTDPRPLIGVRPGDVIVFKEVRSI